METSHPYFTVAVTTYHRADLLVKAIESIVMQSFTDYEVLIIDDASPDNTEEVANHLIEKYATLRIRYVRQPANCGITAVRNEAIKYANGEFIVYLDDDDRFTPELLSLLYRALRDAPQSVVFVLLGRQYVRPSATGDILLRKSSFGFLQETTLLPGERYFERIYGGGTGLTVRLSAAKAVGGFSIGFKNGEDIDLLMRLTALGDFLVLPEAIILVYNLDRPQLTQNQMEDARAQEQLADIHAGKLCRYPAQHWRLYLDAARRYYASKLRRHGRRCMWKVLCLTPFSFKAWRLFLLFEVNQLLPVTIRRRLFSHARHGYQPA